MTVCPCAKAPLRELTIPRGVKPMCPMGHIKTVYYRKGKSWHPVGTIIMIMMTGMMMTGMMIRMMISTA